MIYPFMPEELKIILAFEPADRELLMLELRQALPDIHQPDMKRTICGVICKLADMNDDEFDALGLEDSASTLEDLL